MNRHKLISAIPGIAAACCVFLLVVFAVGCDDKAEKAGPTPTAGGAPAFVNTSCPIMPGNAIDPANVPATLTRTHKGKKVAFCCAGCPKTWDKLTDAEKDAKLAKVTPAKPSGP